MICFPIFVYRMSQSQSLLDTGNALLRVLVLCSKLEIHAFEPSAQLCYVALEVNAHICDSRPSDCPLMYLVREQCMIFHHWSTGQVVCVHGRRFCCILQSPMGFHGVLMESS
jgi:hypothetical protein